MRIRLAGIDAAESRQPYRTRAQQEFSGLAFGKKGRIEMQDTDRYGRTVGTLFIGALNVNREMVRRGAARVYAQYNLDPVLPRLEVRAREARVGLWTPPEHERRAPWNWRHSGGAFGRAEAQCYFRQCGVTRLDGTRDGIPCERLGRWVGDRGRDDKLRRLLGNRLRTPALWSG